MVKRLSEFILYSISISEFMSQVKNNTRLKIVVLFIGAC